MSEPHDFQRAVLQALNGSNPASVVTGVKTVVAEKLVELDDRVDVVFTDYFNHSYMPDMILTWHEGGRRRERPLFVRTDVDPSAIAADIHGLVPQSPLIIAVDERSSGLPARSAVQQEQKSRRVDLLMTDTNSISAIASVGERQGDGYDFSKLIGENFLSGGRGFVGETEAAGIHSASLLADTAESFRDFDAAIDQFFMEDAALRLKRSTKLVRGVLQGDFEQLSLTGQFTQAELRTVLPLLLESSLARETPQLWAGLGEVMSLSDLFDVAPELESLDVSPLLNANVQKWTAKRSQVVMRVVPQEEEEERDNPDGDANVAPPIWTLWRGLLALDVKDWRILFADDARKLKGRSSGGTVPNWTDLAAILPSFNIHGVDLHGLSRRVTISAEKSGDIYGDIASVTQALEESFYVPRITLKNRLDEAETTSVVEFSEMLVTSSPADSLATHARAAVELLLHNRETDLSQLEEAVRIAIRSGPDIPPPGSKNTFPLLP